MSSLQCECGGVIRPEHPLDPDSQYTCDTCQNSLDVEQVQMMEEALKDDLELCYSTDAVGLEKVLNKHKGITMQVLENVVIFTICRQVSQTTLVNIGDKMVVDHWVGEDGGYQAPPVG